MVEAMNPFEKVLDRLREKGWCQGGFNQGERTCIYGAAQKVGSDTGNVIDPLIKEITLTEFPDRTNTWKHPGVAFNDHPDTTFSDVERVLEKAAVKWEEERVVRDD